jgi:HSP20 family molecular chaperone IbpA
MSESVQFADERVMGRQYEYEDRTTLAVDLGHVGEATVDVVDGTAVVVTAEDQYEFDVPFDGATATINNGVLVVELPHEGRTDETGDDGVAA